MTKPVDLKSVIILILTLMISHLVVSQSLKLTYNKGHSTEIVSIDLDSSGKYLVTAAKGYRAKIWDYKGLKLINTVRGELVRIHEGNTFFATDRGVYDMMGNEIDGGSRASYTGSLDISNNGKLVAYGERFRGSGAYIRPIGGSKSDIIELIGHKDDVNAVKFIKNDQQIVTASDDKTIKIWDTTSGSLLQTLSTSSHIEELVIDSSEKTMITGHNDKSINIWDLKQKKVMRAIRPNNKKFGYNGLVLINDDKSFAALSTDGTVQIYDVASGTHSRTIKKSNVIYTAIGYDPNQEKLLLGTEKGDILIFDLADNTENNIAASNVIGFKARSMQDGKLVSAGYGGKIKIWSRKSGQLLNVLDNGHSIKEIEISPEGKFLFTGNQFDFSIWDIQTGKLIAKKEVLGGDTFKRITCSDNGQTVLFSQWAYDAETGKELFEIPKDNIIATGYSSKYDAFITSHKGGEAKTSIWDAKSGELLREHSLENKSYSKTIAVSPIGDHYIVQDSKFIYFKEFMSGVTFRKIELYRDKYYTEDISLKFSNDGRKILVARWNGSLAHYQIQVFETSSGRELNLFFLKSPVRNFDFSSDGREILLALDHLEIFNLEQQKKLFSLHSHSDNSWAAVAPDGRFDGNEEGIKALHYVKGVETIPLESFFERFFTPNLVPRINEGSILVRSGTEIENLSRPPTVKILSPYNGLESQEKTITVKVSAKDQGGGVDEIRLYHNGKMVETTHRGFRASGETKSFTINLVNGTNDIRATAFNDDRTESLGDEITVTYLGQQKGSKLYVLVVGIDRYRNPKYDLNYANKDATSFKESISSSSNGIFSDTDVTYIHDEDATRENILNAFSYISNTTDKEDVFIFYYAGHGAMSLGDKSKFYIIPHEVTKLYAEDEFIRGKAISASELQEFSMTIPAQKQLFILDACQSGGITETLAMRGAAEEKAIAQLARSTGTYWLTATGSEQFATEFSQLGHGVFTYAILEGLKGNADGSTKDNKVTVKELSAYLDDKVPELSEKYKGEPQFPTIYGYGQDFPIIVIRK